ncbi:hypothetical protein ANCDUO_27693 [Ancylostoma duodenale]|uniref:CAAX prenyl protease 1 N-terminal domain-containing protein n=1 Tax=Ancylostoma duodenale TaxID=51022 RepID=A0A0C2F5P8_9BILA|nr:hypothetical protein ANCDUO_27693 [Ancylostoma duodenale]
MEASCLFKLLLGTNWVLFLWNYYLHYRQYNVHRQNEKRPQHVEALITEEVLSSEFAAGPISNGTEYTKARNYKLDKHTFSFAHDLFGQVWTTVVLVGGWLPWLWYACSPYPLPSVVFLAINSLVDTLVDLPWDMYDTFVIEEKHGFNKQTIGFYFADKTKKMALSLVIMAPILLAIEWIVEHGGNF